MDFDIKELKKLISLMNENGLMEIELSEEGRRCVLKKSPPAPAPMSVRQSSGGSGGSFIPDDVRAACRKPRPGTQRPVNTCRRARQMRRTVTISATRTASAIASAING